MDDKDPPIMYRKGFGQVPAHEDISEEEKLWKAFVVEFAKRDEPDKAVSYAEIVKAYQAFVERMRDGQ